MWTNLIETKSIIYQTVSKYVCSWGTLNCFYYYYYYYIERISICDSSNPCKNGATCRDLEEDARFECQCPSGFGCIDCSCPIGKTLIC